MTPQSTGKEGASEAKQGATGSTAASSEQKYAGVMIDLGKQTRKKVKRLRRGEGPLLEEVINSIEGLRSEGKVSASAQPVIVIVERKQRRPRFPFCF